MKTIFYEVAESKIVVAEDKDSDFVTVSYTDPVSGRSILSFFELEKDAILFAEILELALKVRFDCEQDFVSL